MPVLFTPRGQTQSGIIQQPRRLFNRMIAAKTALSLPLFFIPKFTIKDLIVFL
jgi:hypothetical protein